MNYAHDTTKYEGSAMITKEEVLKLLEYDEFTGVFKWRVSRGGVKAGTEAGCIKVFGGSRSGKLYRYIRVNSRYYLAHRLAWLLISGQFPENEIDHINGAGLDNRAVNLRAVTHAENAKNVRKYASNKSGVTGVYWEEARSKWYARITLDGKDKFLGRFDDFEAAVAIRKEAKKLYDYHPNHGETRPL